MMRAVLVVLAAQACEDEERMSVLLLTHRDVIDVKKRKGILRENGEQVDDCPHDICLCACTGKG